MPRDPSGTYSLPANTEAIANQLADASDVNARFDDLANDMNVPRPINAGGTGSTNPSTARDALGLGSAATRDVTNSKDLTIDPENIALRQNVRNAIEDAVADLDLGSAAIRDVTNSKDLTVDPENIPLRQNVRNAIADAVADLGDNNVVGSFAFLARSGAITPGNNYNSGLSYAGVDGSGVTVFPIVTVSGTWKALGGSSNPGTNATLFQRVS